MNQNEQLALIHRELKDIKEDVTELKSRLLNPDDGAIARTNRNTSFRKEMEPLLKTIPDLIQFKQTVTRVLWIVVTAVIAVVVRMVSMH